MAAAAETPQVPFAWPGACWRVTPELGPALESPQLLSVCKEVHVCLQCAVMCVGLVCVYYSHIYVPNPYGRAVLYVRLGLHV